MSFRPQTLPYPLPCPRSALTWVFLFCFVFFTSLPCSKQSPTACLILNFTLFLTGKISFSFPSLSPEGKATQTHTKMMSIFPDADKFFSFWDILFSLLAAMVHLVSNPQGWLPLKDGRGNTGDGLRVNRSCAAVRPTRNGIQSGKHMVVRPGLLFTFLANTLEKKSPL